MLAVDKEYVHRFASICKGAYTFGAPMVGSLTRGLPFQFSLNDHGPHHYISAITPPEVPNEFGDAYPIPAT